MKSYEQSFFFTCITRTSSKRAFPVEMMESVQTNICNGVTLFSFAQNKRAFALERAFAPPTLIIRVGANMEENLLSHRIMALPKAVDFFDQNLDD